MKRLPVVFCILVVLLAVLSCGGNRQHGEADDEADDSLSLLVPETHTAVRCGRFDGTVHRMVTRVPPGRLKELFNDTNDLQLPAARRRGIRPITGIGSAYDVGRPLVRMATCDAYAVDTMWFSLPYLVPRAARLLHDIGQAFRDTIKARGGPEYRIRLTSALRTDYSVARLKRRNRAATEQSCHRYGTTFDVSWTKFDCRDSSHVVSEEDLKNILAEIIWDKRQQGRCFAIFERRQGCFHITVRQREHSSDRAIEQSNNRVIEQSNNRTIEQSSNRAPQ